MFAEKVLRKHVSIIHAYSKMSVLQRKIINVLLYEAIDKKKYLNIGSSVIECSLSFSLFSKLINFKSNNSQYLKEAIDGLASLKIEWNLLKDKVPTDISFINLRVLHGAPTFYKNGLFSFSIHKLMLDLIGNPSIYGSINLDIQSKFESKYAHSLYENSTRFVNLQKGKVIQLDTFRKILGVPENKYPHMRELMRNVIKPSVEEVNDCAEFVVNLENIKIGRRITGLEVSVENKNKISLFGKRIAGIKQSKVQGSIKLYFGELSQSILNSILENYSEDYILEKIDYIKKYAKKGLNALYPIPYFISALRDDYKSIEQLKNDPKQEQPKLIDQEFQVWNTKLNYLEDDLNLWTRHFEHAKAIKNYSLEKSIKKIILKCEEKLQRHLSERPKCDLKTKVV